MNANLRMDYIRVRSQLARHSAWATAGSIRGIPGTLRVCMRFFSPAQRFRSDRLLFTRDRILLLGQQAADYRTDESGLRFGVSIAIITVQLRQGSL
jgi:hypothetical protein